MFIGADVNDTTSLYSFNENYNDAAIPVFVGVFNETSGEELPDYSQEVGYCLYSIVESMV